MNLSPAALCFWMVSFTLLVYLTLCPNVSYYVVCSCIRHKMFQSSYIFLFLSASATLQAPQNMVVETVSNNSIRISWASPRQIGSYRYSIIVFTGALFRLSNVGGSTEPQVVNNLPQPKTYLVMVLAISGNDYSIAYRVHTLGSGIP